MFCFVLFFAFANNKNVGDLGDKVVAYGIFHMNHIKRARLSHSVGDHAYFPQVSTLVTTINSLQI